jgi:hypothetical protein
LDCESLTRLRHPDSARTAIGCPARAAQARDSGTLMAGSPEWIVDERTKIDARYN